MDIVLASASPRRASLLKQVGINFRVVHSRVEEGSPSRPWSEWVKNTAYNKALAVANSSGEIVIAADTIVVHKDRVLGKPNSDEEIYEMLSALSGSVHDVLTGLCIIDQRRELSGKTVVYQEVETTRVYFRKLSDAEIRGYSLSKEPADKAGAYGIQGLGALLVERIEGCYYNIVGLPLVKTMILLRNCGVRILGE